MLYLLPICFSNGQIFLFLDFQPMLMVVMLYAVLAHILYLSIVQFYCSSCASYCNVFRLKESPSKQQLLCVQTCIKDFNKHFKRADEKWKMLKNIKSSRLFCIHSINCSQVRFFLLVDLFVSYCVCVLKKLTLGESFSLKQYQQVRERERERERLLADPFTSETVILQLD